jgi:hypothetical protein
MKSTGGLLPTKSQLPSSVWQFSSVAGLRVPTVRRYCWSFWTGWPCLVVNTGLVAIRADAFGARADSPAPWQGGS